MTAGFYRFLDGELRHASTSVHLPNAEPLLASQKDSYKYPYHGWSWFNSITAAEAYYQINGATNTDWAGFRRAILNENGEYLQGLLLIVSVQPEQNKAPLIEEFLALAARCNLPEAFVTALNEAIIAMTPPPA